MKAILHAILLLSVVVFCAARTSPSDGGATILTPASDASAGPGETILKPKTASAEVTECERNHNCGTASSASGARFREDDNDSGSSQDDTQRPVIFSTSIIDPAAVVPQASGEEAGGASSSSTSESASKANHRFKQLAIDLAALKKELLAQAAESTSASSSTEVIDETTKTSAPIPVAASGAGDETDKVGVPVSNEAPVNDADADATKF